VNTSQLHHKTWGEFTPDDVFEMAVLRSEVFFLEQKITEEEFDSLDRDPATQHLWFSDERGMLGYLRIVHDPASQDRHQGIPDSLGRMVVRKDARGHGLAQKLMAAALTIAGDKPLYLHAQTYVSPLYAKFGFVEHGDVFDEAGIPHILMIRHASPWSSDV
jgi:ElaA protein